MATRLNDANFLILNKNGQAVIFRTDKPDLNVLTFSIFNTADTDLLLKGGVLSGPVTLSDDAGAGAPTCSFFKFDFESMLTSDVIKDMVIEMPEGWDKLFTGPSDTKPASWTLGPKADVTVAPKAQVDFTLSNITCATTRPGNFEVVYGNVPNYSDSRFAITKHLAVENPVDPGKKTLPLTTGFIKVVHHVRGQPKASVSLDEPSENAFAAPEESTAPVVITYTPRALIENGFTYFLKNTTKDPLVPPAGHQADEVNPPVLYISFLFGSDNYDITTQDIADTNLTIGVISNPSKWIPMAHTAGTSYWQFFPQSSFVMDGYETVSFPISEIITELNVDPDEISLMYIQFNNVPGYNDANYVLPLLKKVVEPAIPVISVNKNKIKLGEEVLLDWKTELAWRVTLEYYDRDGNRILLDSVNGDIGLNMTGFKRTPTLEQTKFILNAYYTTDTPTPGSVDVRVDQPDPTIDLFSATPMLADISKQVYVKLSWKATNAQHVTIVWGANRMEVDKNGGTYTDTKQLLNTTLFTLYAVGYGDKHAEVSQWVRVYAYKPGTPLALPYKGDAMQSWPSVLVNRQRKQVYAADGGDKNIYSYDAQTGTPGPTFPGVVMSLSDDGSKLFVYNTDAANFGVSIIDTAGKTPSGPVGFGPVYQMLANPLLTKLYCAATHGVNTVTRLLVDAPNNRLSSPFNITVGTSPRAMAFNKDASKLYVANYDSHSVSIINVSNDTLIKNLDITITEPHSFAYHADKDRLYVACEGSNVVVVIDTATDTVSKQITVGNRPSSVLISPRGGRFVYVANFGENTVSVIDTNTDGVTATLTVGTAPIAMALNADANVFFVANYCSRTLSVVDIVNNIVLPEALPTGDTNGNPFDLAVYADDDYARVYVGKESFKPRIDCATPNNGLGVTVYSIQKPA